MGPRRLPRRLILPACLALLCGCLTSCFSSPPQIISITPNQGSTGIAADQSVTVTFDQPVVHSSVVGKFGVNPALPGCDTTKAFNAPPSAPCYIVWTAGRSDFVFNHPRDLFQPNTTYTFTLGSGLRNTSGVVNDLDHTWQLHTQTAPQVSNFSPGGGTVPSDSTIAVVFDRSMDAVPTEAAIQLSPAVPGTQVLVNDLDPSRFVVLPGRLLTPGVRYTVSVSRKAADYASQRLAAAQSVSFVAGPLSAQEHAVILAGSPGQPASSVILSALTPASPGDPTPYELLLSSTPGSAVRYTAATLSPDGSELAVVETVAGQQPLLRVLDAASNQELADYPGGTLPSWSATGELAFSEGSSVVVRGPTGDTATLPAGAPLAAPPVWSNDGSTLALPVQQSDGTLSVDLATPAVNARYSLPGLTSATDPHFSADDSEIVVERPATTTRTAAVVLVNLTAGAAPTVLAQDLTPIGFAADGSVIAYSTNNDTVVSLTPGGGSTTLPTTIDAFDIGSAVLAPDGREIGYLSSDDFGVIQAYVVTVAGSNAVALTSLAPNGLVAQEISLGA